MVTKGASGRAIICGRWYPAGAWDAGCRQRLYWSGRGESLENLWPTVTRLRQFEMVGEAGFEPATPWPPARCASGLRHSPTKT